MLVRVKKLIYQRTMSFRRPSLRVLLAGIISLSAMSACGFIIADHWSGTSRAISHLPWLFIVGVVALQIVVVLLRIEAWRLCLAAAGGESLCRRSLYGAGACAPLINVVNIQLGSATRVAILRKIRPKNTPPLTAMISAEAPCMLLELGIGAILLILAAHVIGISTWIPAALVGGVIVVLFACWKLQTRVHSHILDGIRVLADRRRRRVLILLVMCIVGAQLARIYLLLHGMGMHANMMDAVAVLVGIGVLSQLPIGPGAHSGASMLVLAKHGGIAAAAALGMAITASEAVVGCMCLIGVFAVVISPIVVKRTRTFWSLARAERLC
jgi:hypothetical protein